MAETLEIIIKATDKASKELQGVSDKLGGLSGVVKGVGTAMGAVGLATGTLVAGFKLLVEPAVNYGLAVSDLATKLGTSAEVASTWIQVADDLRISTSSMNIAFKTLNSQGIQPTIENVGQLADQYNALKSPTEKAQFAMEHFGARAGPELQRLLEKGSQGLRDMAQDAADMGLVIDDLQAQKMVQMYARMDEFGDRVEALKMKLGFFFADILMRAQDAAYQGILLLGHALGIVSDEELAAAAQGMEAAAAMDVQTEAAENAAGAYDALGTAQLIQMAAQAIVAGDTAAARAIMAQYDAARKLEGQLRSVIDLLRVVGSGFGEAELAQSGKHTKGGAQEGYQMGGSLIVPPGYTRDNYLIGVSSGERVTIDKRDSSRKVNIGQVVINDRMDEQSFNRALYRALGGA